MQSFEAHRVGDQDEGESPNQNFSSFQMPMAYAPVLRRYSSNQRFDPSL
jgi:hypothetical protein